MTTKFQKISSIAEKIKMEVTKNKEEWKKYLRASAKLYKYPFDEQLLIYAQRPDATAVASIQFWNQKMHCWVNKGSRGIALIDKKNEGEYGLKYVFDICDVHEGAPYIKKPIPWQFDSSHSSKILEDLDKNFDISLNASLEENIINLSEQLAKEYCDCYAADFLEELRTSLGFNELDDLNAKVIFREVLSGSIAYTVIERCGLNSDLFDERISLEGIVYFDSIRSLAQLGTASSDLSKTILAQIERTIKDHEKGIANNKNMEYNALKRKSESGNLSKVNEGRNEYGINIQTSGGLHDSRYGSGQPGRDTDNRTLWRNEKELSDEGKTGQVQWTTAQWGINTASSGNRHAGQKTTGNNNIAEHESQGDNRGVQSSKSDGLGAGSEQYKSRSGTHSGSGISLHLDLIKKILRDDLHMLIKQDEIISFYLEETDPKIRAEYIKNAYNNEYSSLLIDNQRVGYLKEDDGIFLWQGNYLTRSADTKLAWEKVESLISEMIEEHTYLNFKNDFNNKLPEKKISKEIHEQLSFFPSISQQKDAIEIELNNDSSTTFGKSTLAKYSYIQPKEEKVPAEFITNVLKRGTGFEDGKFRIEQIYKDIESSNERIKKIRKEFGQGGAGWPIDGYGLHGYDTFKSKGLRFQWKDQEGEKEGYVLWTAIAKALGEIIQSGNYITDDERSRYEKKQFIKSRLNLMEQGEVFNINGERYEFIERDFIGRIEVRPLNEENGLFFEVSGKYYLDDYNFLRYEYEFEERSVLIKTDLSNADEEEDLQDHDYILTEKEEKQVMPEEKNIYSSPAGAINFTIVDDNLGIGGPKEKFRNNISAIKTLQLIEYENRLATPEEQKLLSKYVGWGGLSQAFDQKNESWARESAELKDLLSSEEYRAARESTLSAFYTPPKIIREVYTVLEDMGVKKGNILEPAVATGNFFGVLPDSLKDCNLYGVEIDNISGRIAKQLYQKADIRISGFENSDLPDNFFDVAVGNVPFGQFKVHDKKYDKYNFLIHDYFFAKSLDKVRPGGVIIYITSKGTMDKPNGSVRKYISQRAELLGAVRLPNNVFSDNAGTVVTSDILVLKKRERVIDTPQTWQHIEQTPEGFTLNSYFVENPDMVLGELALRTNQYGREDTVCLANPDADLSASLNKALKNISNRNQIVLNELLSEIEPSEEIIEADPTVRNFSYCICDDKLYFRENSKMRHIDTTEMAAKRIRSMIGIRDCVRTLIDMQVEDYTEDSITEKQGELNKLYDMHVDKFGLLNSRGNSQAFSEDSSYPLLASLEILDDKGNLLRKADMFTKRTIRPRIPIVSVDTASEALAISISEKARVDVEYMSELSGIQKEDIIETLKGIIYRVPESAGERFVTADEYLSGNIREKLAIAIKAAEADESFVVNVEGLKQALPKDLEAAEIDVRLGATWLPEDVVNDFMYELLDTSRNARAKIQAKYSKIVNEWTITNKNADASSVKVTSTFGTRRINAYKIIEDTLNLKDVRVMDIIEQDGKERRVLNKKETTIAQQKQELIKNAFGEWVWKEPERRERLSGIYNELFNSVRLREYDGSHITFTNMNPEISLNDHQVNAVARILYGGNTLLAHVVGAGKTFEMVAAAQESKRLGICNKSLFVVPNHLTEQWGSEYLRLYPSANILVTTKKDFEKSNRKKFCSRIATGEYDAIIMGHSQFEKIPMSKERQEILLNMELDEIVSGIEETKRNNGDNLTVKQLERLKKNIQLKLDKLHDTERKDDIVNFEQLGIDRIFVDEAHYFKNLFLYTKMRNVAGISQTEANKSSDLFMKSRYIDEITGGRGLIFATGTPISNSMTEMYTMQRYLQYETLEKYGLQHFDSWASTFGETVTAIELAPEGSGYRAKTRFARFFNLPELMTMFKEVADIKTADMLNLPVPEAEFNTVVLKPSEYQKEYLETLSVRADRVRNKIVEPDEDNMLKITNDGRKLALDQRLIDPMVPDVDGSKTTACATNIFDIWDRTKAEKLTQLVFCDISTPHFDGSFNVYDDIKNKLIKKGMPENEIVFIHSAKTDKQKDDLFAKVRAGKVRVLMGSTQKMGAGTNVQDRLVALHDLDCPWRPSDLEQRLGRIVRQGNRNEKVQIFRYVTENTFDSYLYQLVENKQKFIGQIMTSKSPVRSAEDIDEATLSYAEIKALATGNPLIKEKMDLEISVSRLKVLRNAYLNNKYALEDAVRKKYPEAITKAQEKIEMIKDDILTIKKFDTKGFENMVINQVRYDDKEAAGSELLNCIKNMRSPEPKKIGTYKGFDMILGYNSWDSVWEIILKAELSYKVKLGSDVFGNITRIDNAFLGIPKQLEKYKDELSNLNKQMETAKQEIEKPFAQEEEYKEKSQRLAELDILLNLDNKDAVEQVIETWDISDSQNESIIAALKKSDQNDSEYVLEISGEGEMIDFMEETPWHEENEYITELIINSGVTHIGDNAFEGLKLKKLNLPSTVISIGKEAFRFCFELENVNLGNAISRIESSAFYGCSKLQRVSGCINLLCIKESAFQSCGRLEDIDYPDTCQIREKAFLFCTKLNREAKGFNLDKIKARLSQDTQMQR